MKKICVVTATRAEYGLLRPVIEKIDKDSQLELELVVTGMHLSEKFGCTYLEIEQDGYEINEKIEILSDDNSSLGICSTMSVVIKEFACYFKKTSPDMLIILGDRYEIFAVASAASIFRIPIAHLYGGETTEGAFDEAFRHSITKMSYLHFTATEQYRQRVIQLGEDPKRVFNVGSLGSENIKNLSLLSKEELEKSINFKFNKPVALVTFHPVTLEDESVKKQFSEVLNSFEGQNQIKIIFTKANADTDGIIINEMIDDYVASNPDRTVAFTSLGSLRYLSTLKYCTLVIGNSSSGIIEAPLFKIPTINIGNRQRGRIQVESIINCETKIEDIKKAISLALSEEFSSYIKHVKTPYEKENTSFEIVRIVKILLQDGNLDLKKEFYNLDTYNAR